MLVSEMKEALAEYAPDLHVVFRDVHGTVLIPELPPVRRSIRSSLPVRDPSVVPPVTEYLALVFEVRP
jgi:hypothetical protein